MPVGLQYHWGQKGKWSWHASLLAIPSIYIRSNHVVRYDSKRKNNIFRDDAIRDLHLALQAGLGLNYALGSKIQIFAQPSFYYNLSNMVNTPLRQYLYGAGMEAGARVIIK